MQPPRALPRAGDGVPPRSSGAAFRNRRAALTLIEVLVILGTALLLVIIFAITLPQMRPVPARRVTCAANLAGLGTGMYAYADENNGMWPIAAHASARASENGRVAYAPGKIGTHRGHANNPMAGQTTENDTEMSVTRNLWVLVRAGASCPKSFICPASDDTVSEEDNLQDFWDFRSWNEVSYGSQVPYGKHGRPSTRCDSRMPLAADKGPYGAALEDGQAHPGTPILNTKSRPADWERWNSPNHRGEGQNVLFADGHVKFFATPCIGVENDNIYTQWSNASGGSATEEAPRVQGTPPASNETPWGDTDTLVYP